MVNQKLIKATHGLHGKIEVPGDKSMSHRALILASIAQGTTTIHGLLAAADVLTTQRVYEQLGVPIWQDGAMTKVQGRGFLGFTQPRQPLDFGNSGTTLRLSLGVLVAQPFSLTLVGDASLSQRPMGRVLEPLTLMGLQTVTGVTHLPIQLKANSNVKGMVYQLPIASAQVKSAIILAGLQAQQPTTIIEPIATRDHTEQMLREFGVTVFRDQQMLTVLPQTHLQATELTIPGDFSSAAFWITGALLTPKSRMVIQAVGLNQTRTGLLRLFERMGAVFTIKMQQNVGEQMGDIAVENQSLHGIDVDATDIPAVIDELPLLVLAATQATGITRISGAAELRVKETDRIRAVTETLNQLGANITAKSDGFEIVGPTPLAVKNPTVLSGYGDHRIVMMLAIAALITDGSVYIDDLQAIEISYPQFFDDLKQLV